MQSAPATHHVYPNDRQFQTIEALQQQIDDNDAQITQLTADIATQTALHAALLLPTISTSLRCFPTQGISATIAPLTVNNGNAQAWITWNPSAGVFATLQPGTYLIFLQVWFRRAGPASDPFDTRCYIENVGVTAPQCQMFKSQDWTGLANWNRCATCIYQITAPNQDLRCMAMSNFTVLPATIVGSDNSIISIMKLA